jgi:hypothetical protein
LFEIVSDKSVAPTLEPTSGAPPSSLLIGSLSLLLLFFTVNP